MAGGLLDIFTGGEDETAAKALSDAQQRLAAIQTPTAEQLTLPQLQQYVQFGLMTPADAQAYLQKNNALATENVDQTGTGAMQEALGQLSSIADAGPNGTPEQQAQMANTIEQMNQAVVGQRGSIEQSMEAKGTPTALIQAALAEENQGQDAQQAYLNSINSQAAAYQAAVQALSGKANVGGALQGMENTQANTVANAQNAMEQFNAANQQNASEANAARAQQANAYNTQTGQNVGNQNTELTNERTMYNTQVPQKMFENAITKATGQNTTSTNQANQAMQQGQQNAGIFSGLLGAAATLYGGPAAGAAVKGATQTTQGNNTGYVQNAAHGGVIGDHEGCYHEGGICMEGGGMVPGKPEVPGDSLKNDHVHAMLSPGEAVIPRTAVKAHMPEVLGLISHGGNVPRGTMPHLALPSAEVPPAHPHDVASVLQALKEIRMGRS